MENKGRGGMKARLKHVATAMLALAAGATIGVCILMALSFRLIHGERCNVTIECPVFDAGRLAEASFLAESLVPGKATDIRLLLSYQRGGLMGGPKDRFGGLGAYADMRCRVSMEGLLEFAKEMSYEFQSESITKNADTNGLALTHVDDVWRRSNPGDIPFPKKFLAYNHIHACCGGYSFLYDVDSETLYATYVSN